MGNKERERVKEKKCGEMEININKQHVERVDELHFASVNELISPEKLLSD